MSYTKQNFVDGNILYASGLNAMDNCIETVEQDVTILKSDVSSLNSEINNFLSNNKIIEDIQTSADADDNTVLTIQYSTGETKTITLVGNSLNFKIVGGETEPASPTENMIWVNTSEEITSYLFSATEPESPEEGMVWINVGRSSAVEFNVLKKDAIQVYPLAAKQYVSSAWADVEAKTYQGGQWVEWTIYLYAPGDECTKNGGNWVSIGKNISSDGLGSHAVTLTLNDDNMNLVQTEKGGIVYKEQTISLTDVSTINIKGTHPSAVSGDHWTCLNVWTSLGTYFGTNRVAYLNFGKTGGTFDLNLDVSGLTGTYYIGFGLYGAQTLIITEVSLQ